MHSFSNDYSEGAAPEILAAIAATAAEQSPGYTEGDTHCERARELIRAACGAPDAAVEFCIGGTSTNVICLTGMLRDWEGVICTKDAHIVVHETGALAACGRTVLPTADADGFLSPGEAERVWRFQTSTGRHMTRPAAIYITNSTELGGVWDRARFDAICDWARSRDLGIFLDGARLGSALTSTGNDLTLAHIASRVDAFYVGGTKNGMLMGEAVVISGTGVHARRLREAFPYLVKERGGLLAKGFLLGAQFEAAFETGAEGAVADAAAVGGAAAVGADVDAAGEALYWRLARSANENAARLREGLAGLGFEPYGTSTSNQQFFSVTPEIAEKFERAAGCEAFYTLDDGRKVIRFVCSWATRPEDVDELLDFAKGLR